MRTTQEMRRHQCSQDNLIATSVPRSSIERPLATKSSFCAIKLALQRQKIAGANPIRILQLSLYVAATWNHFVQTRTSGATDILCTLCG
jgi:hypothetical protein